MHNAQCKFNQTNSGRPRLDLVPTPDRAQPTEPNEVCVFNTCPRSASTNPGREPLDEAPLPVLVVGSQLNARTKSEAANNAMDG